MTYKAEILADSINPDGNRLTTFCVTYPRFVHSELMTHRAFSRNAASSRAIPITKMIQAVQDDPVMPVWWGKNQAGMQAREELTGSELEQAKYEWLIARDDAIGHVRFMSGGYHEGPDETSWEKGPSVHKQLVNRLLEPWMWITVIISATEYENFFHLRCHPDAQPELQKIAYMMQELYHEHKPTYLEEGIWHLPLVQPEESTYYTHANLAAPPNTVTYWVKVAVGRCARVSYLTHDGKRDPQADIELHDRLLESGHWSPFEHVAQATTSNIVSGNFTGWLQYRKSFLGENYVNLPV